MTDEDSAASPAENSDAPKSKPTLEEVVATELARERAKDARRNAETAPPETERIRIPAVMVAEVYAASHAKGLVAQLEDLGWAEKGLISFEHANLAEWVLQARVAGVGSSINVGWIVPPATIAFPHHRTAPFPLGIESAEAMLSQLTPSLTVLTAVFHIAEEFSASVEQALRSEYETLARPNAGGYAFFGPGAQKKDSARDARKAIHERAASWFRMNLPGGFSEGVGGIAFPTFELLVTSEASPFFKQDLSSLDDYRWILGIANDFEAYYTGQLPSWRACRPDLYEAEPYVIRFGGRMEQILSDKSLDHAGERTLQSASGRFFDQTNVLLERWALDRLLAGYQSQLGKIRDRGASQDKESASTTVRRLQDTSRALGTIAADARAVALESLAFTADKGRYGWDTPNFEPAHERRREFDKASLVENFRIGSESRAKQILDVESHVRSTLTTDANLASAAANLNLQRIVIGLSIAIAILTIISLGLAWRGAANHPPRHPYVVISSSPTHTVPPVP